MSEIDITSQENTLELPKFEETLPDFKPEPRKDLKYEIKHEPKSSFGQSSKDLIEQYKSKFNAFKQLAEDQQPLAQEPSVIEKSEKSDIWRSDAEILKSPKEWDWNILGSKKASTTSNQIQFDVHVPDPIACEQEHKAQIAQHRQMILGVLDQRIEPGLKLPQSHQPQKPVVGEQHSNYQNILEKFRSASSLDDLTTLFNTVQQRKVVDQAAPQQQQSEDLFSNLDIRRNKKAETQIQQYKTPSKSQEEIFEYGSGNRTTSFFQKKPSAQKQLLQSPSLGNQFNYRSDQSVTSKVTQNMNFQVDVKDHSKTSKRKEELQSFMGKLGLGKYDTPKVVINLESNSQSNSTIDRMRQYVNGTPMSARKSGGGLGDLINERSLNTTTFKQQIKSYHKSGSKQEASGRMSADTQNLSEQSLRNLHLKLVHQQKNGIGSSGLKYARC
ncbi:unnamed protein product [Paramecium octaurelia]|uniref:Uncharacterized protein n=1 Tax=Paramecium octaurelia TaxID=43137 RepID=A0A8S1YAE6_PAROT|nr:unnamed protein product [Paramecium octaurelia]